MDLLASLASLLGESYSDRTDSQNTLSSFLGLTQKGRSEMVIEGMFDYAFRQDEWVLLPPYPGDNKAYELYNIKKDPGQQNNLADEKPKKVRQMLMRFEQLKRETGKQTNY
jgi:hypothetical protein BACCOPRO_02314